MNNIRVIIKKPNDQPYMTVIENDLKKLQEIVGGYIETVSVCTEFVIICNEEGRIKQLPYNCTLFDIDFVGSIIFAGVSDDEFSNLPISYGKFRDMFSELYKE